MNKQRRETVRMVETRACGKYGYESRSDAKRSLRRHRGAGLSRGVRPYLCPDCGCWHLGHLPRPVRAGLVTATEFFA